MNESGHDQPDDGSTVRDDPAGGAPAVAPPSSSMFTEDEVQASAWARIHLQLLERIAPPSLLVDADDAVIHLSPQAGRFLRHGAGTPTRHLLRLVPPELREPLRGALGEARRLGAPVAIEVPDVLEALGAGQAGLRIRAVPLDAAVGAGLVLVLFDETPAAAVAHPLLDPLRSRHDEFAAAPVELRSKLDELARANADLHHLMNATAIATVFLDRELRLARYTPAAAALLQFSPAALGEPLRDLAPRLRYAEFEQDARRVLALLVPLEREVGLDDGRWFLAKLLPFRTADEQVAGLVLHFIDITERKRAEEVSQWLSAVVASSVDAIISFSRDGTVLSWNKGARRVFGYPAEEVIGQPLRMLTDPRHARNVQRVIDEIVHERSVENAETTGRSRDGHPIHLAMTASPITDAEGRVVGGMASLRDIGDARRNAEALRRSDERLRLVIENARDYAIFSTDDQRVITSWNHGAERLLGYTEAQAVGQSADMIFTPEDRAAGAPEHEASTAAAEERAADERFHMRRDGSIFWASGTLMRMHDDTGGAVGFVKILRDETQARKAQAALQRSQAELLQALKDNEHARAELEAADEAKDRFLAVLSHELRNPLAAVISAAALLRSEDAPPLERARAAGVVQRQARTMKSLLDDLLDVSRLAAGRLPLRMQDCALAEIVAVALETVQPSVKAAGHLMRVTVPESPVRLHADPLRISQVLVNLLANAVKYTPPGAGELTLEVRTGDEEVQFIVSDNGIGMSPDRIEDMFELYTQGPATSHAHNEGLGVGLSLVRTIVALHGGTVDGTSEGRGLGSRFIVRLPHIASPLPGDAATTSEGIVRLASPSPPPTLTVLLVDDNEDAAWTLSRLLGRAGHRVLLANAGAQALSLAERERPDAAILDLGMPDMDGLELARRLRAMPLGPRIALVALTGWSSETHRARALAEGFDALLSKPADLPQLFQALEQALLARRT